jgi:DNA-directed RNA polymerase specialized sigma24 family protein
LALSLADEVMRQEQEDEGPVDRILALRACMARLDDRQRQILSLRYAPEGPYRMDEIARSDGMKPEALYKKLERLRAGLRDCVTQRMKGGGGDV